MPVKPLASQREAALETLRAHYAHDTIDLHEYERRVEAVTLADDLALVEHAVADLQPLQTQQPTSTALAWPENARVPMLSIFGSMERRSGWLAARNQKVVTVFGNAELGLLDTPLPDGVTTLDIACVFGNVELTVPAGLRVELQVTSILANAEDHGRAPPPGSGPILRLRGVCVFGNVEIKRVG